MINSTKPGSKEAREALAVRRRKRTSTVTTAKSSKGLASSVSEKSVYYRDEDKTVVSGIGKTNNDSVRTGRTSIRTGGQVEEKESWVMLSDDKSSQKEDGDVSKTDGATGENEKEPSNLPPSTTSASSKRTSLPNPNSSSTTTRTPLPSHRRPPAPPKPSSSTATGKNDDEEVPVTPARKLVASIAFSTAAAVASAHRSNTNTATTADGDLDDEGPRPRRQLDFNTVIQQKEDGENNSMKLSGSTAGAMEGAAGVMSPLRTIQGLLSTIPGHFAAAGTPRMNMNAVGEETFSQRRAVTTSTGSTNDSDTVGLSKTKLKLTSAVDNENSGRDNANHNDRDKSNSSELNFSKYSMGDNDETDVNDYIHPNNEELEQTDEEEQDQKEEEEEEETSDGNNNICDSSCISFGTMIMIRSRTTASVATNGNQYYTHASLSVEEEEQKDDRNQDKKDSFQSTPSEIEESKPKRFMARMNGVGLSRRNECIFLSLASSGAVVPDMMSTESLDYDFGGRSRVLRYGDVVAIHSPFASNRALGVRKIVSSASFGSLEHQATRQSNGNGILYELGFFRTVLGQAEKWTVLHGRQGRVVTVGSSASSTNIVQNTDAKKSIRKRIVRSGEPILLRNVYTGGLLSLCKSSSTDGTMSDLGKEHITVITSSYQITSGVGNSIANKDANENNNHLLTFLQHQHRVKPTMNETFHLVHFNVPPCPQWASSNNESKERPYLVGSHLKYLSRDEIPLHMEESMFRPLESRSRSAQQARIRQSDGNDGRTSHPLGLQSVDIQEQILVDEVIGCMMGVEGHFIQSFIIEASSSEIDATATQHEKIGFRIAPFSVTSGDLDLSLKHLTERFLPICEAYVNVNIFVCSRLMEYEHGNVSHALCGAIDVLLQEYLNFVSGLEKLYRSQDSESKFTLSALYGSVHPAMRTMCVLNRVVKAVWALKGGNLLNTLQSLMEAEYLGDEKAQCIVIHLLEKASAPYMEMLRCWLERGTLEDPYGEFMIEQNVANNHNLCVSLITDDSDWSCWYGIREEHVLKMLTSRGSIKKQERGNLFNSITIDSIEDEVIRRILTTGKYWNALALCHTHQKSKMCDSHNLIGLYYDCHPYEICSDEISTLKYCMGAVDVCKFVDREYKCASKMLLNVVMRDYCLIQTLRFMKRYFLLDQGDFFVHFLDMAEDELLQEMTEVSRGRIQNWMSMSIQLSNVSGDLGGSTDVLFNNSKKIHPSSLRASRRENNLSTAIASSLKCVFSTVSLVDHLDALHASSGGISSHEPKTPSRHVYGGANKGLTGVEAFMLDFDQVSFPLSLFLSRQTMTKYQLLFRHLFFAKHVERRLVGTWLDHQMIKEYQTLRKDLGPTYCLRQRMLHFMQNFVYYMMFEVIEPNWLHMESKILQRTDEIKGKEFEWTYKDLQQQHTIDDVLMIHSEFVRRTLKECLLTNRDLIKTLTKLMTTCLLFSDQMKLFMESVHVDKEQNKMATEERQRRQQSMFESIDNTSVNKKKMRQALLAAQEQRRARKKKQIDRLQRELNTESYKKMIIRFEQVFNTHLSEFMSQLMSDSDGRYHSHLSNLCIRLDYNGYVTSSMKV